MVKYKVAHASTHSIRKTRISSFSFSGNFLDAKPSKENKSWLNGIPLTSCDGYFIAE